EHGYTGRDQRVDLPEKTRREIAQVQSGVHPSNFWYHIDDWRKRFKEIVERYNNTKQQGEWLPNISPNDAFVQFQNPNDPPIKLDAQSWPYLAAQKSRRQVDKDGVIKFRLLGESYRYFNEETTARIGGEMVITWWNPETPEFL